MDRAHEPYSSFPAIEKVKFGPISENGWQLIHMDGGLYAFNYSTGRAAKYNKQIDMWTAMRDWVPSIWPTK